MKRNIFIIILALAVFAGIYGWYMYEKPVANIAGLKPEFNLDATELYGNFESDEDIANDKYLGKIIELNGTVREKLTDESGLTVILETENEMFGINCGLGEGQEAAFEKLNAGDKVTIRGECAGFTMDVVMVRCVIIS